MKNSSFDNQDSDDLEDFFLINGVFEDPDEDPDRSGDQKNDNYGCGTILLLIIVALLLSRCF